jgi:hypothetical protein
MEATTMTTLRLAKEYLAPPIFCSDPEEMGHVDLEDLPISDDLRLAIKIWNDEYQATFDSEYPAGSGFDTPEAEKNHVEIGVKLAEKLHVELGKTYLIEYEA